MGSSERVRGAAVTFFLHRLFFFSRRLVQKLRAISLRRLLHWWHED